MSKQITTAEALIHAVHAMTGQEELTLAMEVNCLDDLAKEITTRRGKLVADAKKAVDEAQRTLQQLNGKGKRGRPNGSKNRPKSEGAAA